MAPIFKPPPHRGRRIPGRLPWSVTRGLTHRWPLDAGSTEFKNGVQTISRPVVGNIPIALVTGYSATSDARHNGAPPFDGPGHVANWNAVGDASSLGYFGDAVSFSYSPYPTHNGDIPVTVSLWLNLNSLTTAGGAGFYPRIILLNNDLEFYINVDDPANSYLVMIFGNGLQCRRGQDIALSRIPERRWCHVAFTYNGSNIVHLYIDGVEVTISPAGSTAAAGQYVLGCRDNSGARSIDGRLADLRFYTGTVLEASEVNELYNSAFTTELFSPDQAEWPALFTSGVPPTFVAAWAGGSNLPVIGTGNY